MHLTQVKVAILYILRFQGSVGCLQWYTLQSGVLSIKYPLKMAEQSEIKILIHHSIYSWNIVHSVDNNYKALL